MNETRQKYAICAKVNDASKVIEVYSTFFKEKETDDFVVKEGYGQEYIHCHYAILDNKMCHNYKLADGKIVETTEEEKAHELKSMRQVPKTEIEMVQDAVEGNQADIYTLSEKLLSTETELTAKSQELEKTKAELTKTKAELTKTKNELEMQKATCQELSDYMLEIDTRLTAVENK